MRATRSILPVVLLLALAVLPASAGDAGLT